VESWSLRDTHMTETLEALLAHVRQTGGNARAVIWHTHTSEMRAQRI
jgi:erythromycin esterase-like protein